MFCIKHEIMFHFLCRQTKGLRHIKRRSIQGGGGEGGGVETPCYSLLCLIVHKIDCFMARGQLTNTIHCNI